MSNDTVGGACFSTADAESKMNLEDAVFNLQRVCKHLGVSANLTLIAGADADAMIGRCRWYADEASEEVRIHVDTLSMILGTRVGGVRPLSGDLSGTPLKSTHEEDDEDLAADSNPVGDAVNLLQKVCEAQGVSANLVTIMVVEGSPKVWHRSWCISTASEAVQNHMRLLNTISRVDVGRYQYLGDDDPQVGEA